jgi:hypothetical protein
VNKKQQLVSVASNSFLPPEGTEEVTVFVPPPGDCGGEKTLPREPKSTVKETANPPMASKVPRPARPGTSEDLSVISGIAGKDVESPSRSIEYNPSSPQYGHAPDYAWLKGEIQVCVRSKRLRFAPVDEADPYGGSVSLPADPQIEGLKDGQIALVRGHLIDPETRTSAPLYKVLSIEALSR